MAEVFRNSSVEMWKWPRVWDLLYTLRSTEDRAAAGSLGLTWAHFRLSSDHFRLTSDQFGSVQAQQEVVGVQRLAQLAH